MLFMSGKELKQVVVQSGMHLLGIHQPLGKLLTLVQDENCKLRELIDTIECDPTLVHEFIRISAADSLSSWHQNLTFESAKAVTINLCIETLGKDSAHSVQPLIEQFWLHSVAMAVTCQSVVQAIDQVHGGGSNPAHVAYLTGLMSALGQIQLLASQGDSYEEFLRNHLANQAEGISEQELTEEAEKFGRNRFELAADFVDAIDSDSSLAEAIRYHYFPLDSLTDSHWLVRSLALARVVAPTLTSADMTLTDDCYLKSSALLGLDRTQLEEIAARAVDHLARIKLELGISESRTQLDQTQKFDEDLVDFKKSVSDASVIAVIRGYLAKHKNATDWWADVEKSARLMFGFKNCFMFELNKQHQMLRASDFCVDVAGFGVSVKAAHSILGRCVQESRIVSSYEIQDLSVVDLQLSRLAGGKELVCIPLSKESEIVAVLVCGLSEDQALPLFAGSCPASAAPETTDLEHRVRHAESTVHVNQQDTNELAPAVSDSEQDLADSYAEIDRPDNLSPHHDTAETDDTDKTTDSAVAALAIDQPLEVAAPVVPSRLEVANSNLMSLFSDLIISTCREHVLANRDPHEQGSRIDLDYFRRRAREVTHEINNPLSVVQNYMKILSLKLDEESSAQADLATISQEISRISGIVQKFTELGTEDEVGRGIADVNQIIGDIVSVFKGSSPEIKFVLQLDDGVPGLNQSRDTIKQILVNLLKNSKEALGDSGCIVIGTSSPVNVGGEHFMEILISDDGPGIPPAVEARLFQEVHSEKGFGHEGLGLNIVKQLVDEMHGLITCRSRLGTGTDFQILIPLDTDEIANGTTESTDTFQKVT
jgi:nitrogen-specific signal transduction histidine kinase/HD-like signal output (HDOD) protein